MGKTQLVPDSIAFLNDAGNGIGTSKELGHHAQITRAQRAADARGGDNFVADANGGRWDGTSKPIFLTQAPEEGDVTAPPPWPN